MRELNIEMTMYCPRSGHDSVFKVDLTEDEFCLIGPYQKSARYTFDIETGLGENQTRETIDSVLTNESLVLPVGLNDSLGCIWEDWKNEDKSDEETQSSFIEMADWINSETSRSRDTQ